MKKKLRSVLIIDDDPAFNFLNRKLLEKADVAEKIEVVMNGKEAINYLISIINERDEPIETWLPALIILDINMPVMDGWEFLEQYQNLDGIQKDQISIVMLSTSINPDDRIRAENHKEIAAYKTKPLTLPIIKEIADNYLPTAFQRE